MVDTERETVLAPARPRCSRVASATRALDVAVVPSGKPPSRGATARVRAALWPAPVADRLARQNPAARLVARHGLGEAQPRRLPKALETDEKERAVRDDRPADRAAELIERQLLLLVVVLAGRIHRIVAQILEDGAAERLPPLLVTTVMLPPEPRPLSAGARPELTRNSATDSIDVCRRNCEPVAVR